MDIDIEKGIDILNGWIWILRINVNAERY